MFKQNFECCFSDVKVRISKLSPLPFYILFSSLLFSATVNAQTAIEEITVTATKRGAVSVQDYAGSIRAITGDTIEKYDLRSLEDITRLEPSLQYATQGVGDSQLIIRGISSPGDSTVGVYFDESPITGGNFQDGGGRTPDIGAYDIERVEVLKGPQGTLFGASSMSGTVRIITNKPDASAVGGNISVGGESTDNGNGGYSVNGAVNIPIIKDQLALRVVGWQKEQGGYIDHFAGLGGPTEIKDANDSEVMGGRLMARWTPNEDLTVDAFYQLQETEVDGIQHFAPVASGLLTPTQVIVVPFPLFIPAFAGQFGDLTTSVGAQEPYKDEIDMYGVTVNYDMGFGSVIGTVSKFERDIKATEDTSATAMSFGFPPAFGAPAIGPYGIHQFQKRDVLNAEIRFSSDFDGPINLVTGFFYEDDETSTELNILASDPVTGIPTCFSRDECNANAATLPFNPLAFARSQDIDFEFFALFGHIDYEVNDKITLGGGLRYFDSEQKNLEQLLQAFQGSINFTIPPLFGGPIQTVPIVTVDDTVKSDEITWDAVASYQHNEDQLYYFKAGTGIRQGGINDAATAAAFGIAIPGGFTSDKVTSLEFGAKTSWLDNRVTFNATYFKMFWKNMQVPGVEPTGAVEFIANAAKAEVDGVEIELTAQPTDQFYMNFGVTWINAELTADQIVDPTLAAPGFAPPLGVNGDKIPKVPEWAFSGSAEYKFPNLGNFEPSFRGNFSYTGSSETFFNPSFPGFIKIGDYFLLNLNADFQHENWGLRFFVNNVTDERAAVDIDGAAGPDTFRYFTVRPRTFGAQLTYTYN